MKSKYLFGGLLCVLLAASLLSFNRNDMAQEYAGDAAEFAAPSSLPSMYGFAKDSFSNATTETKTIPGIIANDYIYSIDITLAAVSGTRAMKIYLDKSNGLGAKNSGIYATDYVLIDSLTPTATLDNYTFQGRAYGQKYRVRVKGNTGATQVVGYTVNALFKPTR